MLNVVLTSCLLATLPLLPDEDQAVREKSEWKIDDVIKQESASGFDISPDGKWVVWVKGRPSEDKDSHVNDLMLTNMSGEKEIRLTRSDDNDFSPQWRPDGEMITFLSNRKGKGEARGSQIWLINPFGGEPWQLTTLEHGVRGYSWIDSERMLILTREDSSLYEQELKKKKDDTRVVEDEEHFTPYRLFEFTMKDKKLRRLTTNDLPINSFELSHNGRYAVASLSTSPHSPDPKAKPKYFLFDLQEGMGEEIFKDPSFYPFGFEWALDDSGFYFQRTHTSDYENRGPGARFPYWFDLAEKTYSEIPIDHEWGLGGGFAVTKDGFVTGLAAGTRVEYARYTRENGKWTKQLLEYDDIKYLASFGLAEDGETALAIFSAADNPPRVYACRLEENRLVDACEIIALNKNLRDKTTSRVEVINWTGALGDTVEGVLYYPHDYVEGKKYPVVLMIHGGPTGVDTVYFRESWSAYPNLMAGKGAFVLRVNYHGSGNYGQAWAESIKEKYYDLEVPDIIAGVDYLIGKGMVESEKQGVMGWSNGAILTYGLILEHPDRFKVAAPGAGDVNWISDYGNCAFGPTFDNYYFGGAPWEIPEEYVRKSPLFRMGDIKVPVIIFFGTEDTNVPTEQGWEQFRALQLLGKVPVRFLIFPGEPHGLRKLTHQRRKMEEEIAWFDKYLFAAYEEPNEAFKKDSPLEIALKSKDIRRDNGRYGVIVNNTLVPEVVKSGELMAGRFEVTRAQYAQFDKDYKYADGTCNWPATNVSFEKAKQYCIWLSGKTGETYRLPTVKEMEKLLGTAKSNAVSENTLDYWAGYTLNPEDSVKLLEKIEELGEGAVLLMQVGRMKPVGDDPIFDLGGNAAEWCVGDNDTAETRGGCAIQSRDERTERKQPPATYIGFRVLKETGSEE